MHEGPWNRRALPAIAACLLATPLLAAMPEPWIERWREDLQFVADTLESEHPDAWHAIPRDEFQAELDTLSGRLPELDHPEVIAELARIVARVGDGHTRLTWPLAGGRDFQLGHSETPPPALDSMLLRLFPLRVSIDDEGVWVRRADASMAELLGGRVVAIDGRPMSEVVDRLTPFAERDNAMQVRHELPLLIVLPDLLHAGGVTADATRARWTIDTREGRRLDVTLVASSDEGPVAWVDAAGDDVSALPLYLRHTDSNYWMEWLPGSSTIYLQFNLVQDAAGESIRELGERLVGLARDRHAERLVIDLRHNRGGDNTLGRVLLSPIERSGLARAGSLYAIVGRTTFSAAMSLALELERYTPVLFVGEPTGARPNHFGDSRKNRLPNSGLTLRVATLWWQWDPRDDRPWIAPQIEAAETADSYCQRRDPVLEAILAIDPHLAAAPIDGEWIGTLTPRRLEPDSRWTVDTSAPTPVVHVDLAPYGLLDLTATAVEATSEQLRLDVPIGEEGSLHFTGTRAGDWIVGHADLGSLRFPFAVRRTRDAGAELR